MMVASSKRHWVFSLALDDTLRWAAAEIDDFGRTVPDSIRSGEPLRTLPDYGAEQIGQVVAKALHGLKSSSPGCESLFKRVRAVGVSCPGVVDTKSGRLLNIDRKDWRPAYPDDDFIVDFKDLLCGDLFPNVTAAHVSAHNDVTAKCLAEFEAQRESSTSSKPIESIWYVNLHTGINAAVMAQAQDGARTAGDDVERQRGLVSLLHHEIGHQQLLPDPADTDAVAYSSCPVHTYCFTGLASGARVRRQWGAPLPALDPSLDERIFDAWRYLPRYMATFVYNLILTVQTERVVFAGDMVSPRIIQRIAEEFDEMNAFRGRPYIDFAALRRRDFFGPAMLHVDLAGSLGGLGLARRVLQDPRTPPVRDSLTVV